MTSLHAAPSVLCGAYVAITLSMGCSAAERPSERATATDAGARDARGAADATMDAPRLFPSQIPADFQCDPTLESIRTGIFETSCGWDSCHGNNNAAWGLYLVADVQSVYDGLVNVRSGSCSGWILVTPGDPELSFLWNKVTQEKPACGERMPRGVEPLPDVALECLRGWIEQL